MNEERIVQDPVSVIIPVYNATSTIEQCIESVLKQDYSNLRIVIVDDCSSDDTVRKVKKYDAKVIVNNKNFGVSYTRNIGAKAVNSNILVFLDSDVVIPKNGISRLVELLLEKKDIKVIGSKYSENTRYMNFISDYKNMDLVYRTFAVTSNYRKTFSSFFFAIKKTDFMSVGGFPVVSTGISNPSVEDTALGYILSEGRNFICFNSDIFVDHLKTYSLFSMIKTNFERISGLVAIRKKSGGKYKTGENSPLTCYINILLPMIIILSFLLGCLFKVAWFPLLVFLGFVLNNNGFIRFLVKRKGLFFALKGIFIIFIEYLGVLLSIFISLIAIRKQRTEI